MSKNTNKEVSLTGGFSLQPKNLEEAMKMAELIAKSDLAPPAYRNKPGNVLIAVQMGAELGVPPMQSLQNIAVINGKPGIYGDMGKAILQKNGCQIHIDDISLVRQNEIAKCIIKRSGHPTVERTFSVQDAKDAGLWGKAGAWTNYKWRQLTWRAFWFAARDIASDLLKGMNGVEEIIDMEPMKDTSSNPDGENIFLPKQYKELEQGKSIPKEVEEISKEVDAVQSEEPENKPVEERVNTLKSLQALETGAETTIQAEVKKIVLQKIKDSKEPRYQIFLQPENEDPIQTITYRKHITGVASSKVNKGQLMWKISIQDDGYYLVGLGE